MQRAIEMSLEKQSPTRSQPADAESVADGFRNQTVVVQQIVSASATDSDGHPSQEEREQEVNLNNLEHLKSASSTSAGAAAGFENTNSKIREPISVPAAALAFGNDAIGEVEVNNKNNY